MKVKEKRMHFQFSLPDTQGVVWVKV